MLKEIDDVGEKNCAYTCKNEKKKRLKILCNYGAKNTAI
jgi:hypothetical protein